MSNDAHSHKPHIIPLRAYLLVAAALMVLTAVTVGVSFIHLGGWNAIVAVGIASVKALLVAFIFMHLWYDKKIYLIIFSVSLLFLTVFIALTMFDTLRRGDIESIKDGPIQKDAVIYRQEMPDTTGKSGAADSLSKSDTIMP